MPLEERTQRHTRMFAHLLANDIDYWAERFLSALAESRRRPGILAGLQQLFSSPLSLTG